LIQDAEHLIWYLFIYLKIFIYFRERMHMSSWGEGGSEGETLSRLPTECGAQLGAPSQDAEITT